MSGSGGVTTSEIITPAASSLPRRSKVVIMVGDAPFPLQTGFELAEDGGVGGITLTGGGVRTVEECGPVLLWP
jgi:hypothetical protein